MTHAFPRRLAIALAIASFATAAFARDQAAAPQQQTPPSAANQAANLREQPVTDALNTVVKDNLDTQAAISAEQQAQYDLDRAAYRDAVKARAAQVSRDNAYQMRQEDAYARAMIAWRIQTDECARGILKSCKKPTPMPADFY